jgi:hypothetical protein
MEASMDDSLDSKTLGVGRKRQFQGPMQSQEAIDTPDDHDVSDEEPVAKRVKEDRELSSNASIGDGLMTNITSPLQDDGQPAVPTSSEAHSSLMEEGWAASQGYAEKPSVFITVKDGVEKALAPDTPKKSIDLTRDESDVSPPPKPESQTLPVAPTTTTWNAGVQGGLRTSFGSKNRFGRGRGGSIEAVYGDAGSKPDVLPRKDSAKVSPSDSKVPQDPEDEDSSSSEGEDDEFDDDTSITGSNVAIDPAAPPKVKRLMKWEQDKLSPEERKSYQTAYTAYLKAKKIQRLEAKATKGDAFLKGQTATFKSLSPQKQQALSKKEKKRYVQAKKVHDAMLSFEARTAEAEAVLARIHTWPPPNQDNKALKDIAEGRTFFPRATPSKDLKYRSGKGEFGLFEILDNEGKPIKAQNFSFNIFAPVFLRDNQDKWELISQRVLEKAFSVYNHQFYVHIIPHVPGLNQTSKAHNAIEIGAAKRQAKLLPERQIEAGRSGFAERNPEVLTSLQPDDRGERPKRSEHPKKLSIGLQDGNAQVSIAPNSAPNEFHDPIDADIAMGDSSQLAPIDMESTRNQASEKAEIMDVELGTYGLALQQKYFPTTTTQRKYQCLSCARIGHTSSSCPALSCTICGVAGKHSNMTCPKNLRCIRCYGKGHTESGCPERLQRAETEAIACDICGSKDHLEVACSYLWRSFDPRPEEILTVRDIPVHCYCCGASDHYGPECGLHRGRPLPGIITWSKANLRKYLDPASQNRALSAGIDYSIPRRSKGKGYSIKGRANDPIALDESGDEEGFIRPKISSEPQRGNINFGPSRQENQPWRPGRALNPPRDTRPVFERNVRSQMESARYGREAAFSPPPSHSESGLRYNVTEAQRGYIEYGNASGPSYQRSSSTGGAGSRDPKITAKPTKRERQRKKNAR